MQVGQGGAREGIWEAGAGSAPRGRDAGRAGSGSWAKNGLLAECPQNRGCRAKPRPRGQRVAGPRKSGRGVADLGARRRYRLLRLHSRLDCSRFPALLAAAPPRPLRRSGGLSSLATARARVRPCAPRALLPLPFLARTMVASRVCRRRFRVLC